MRCDWRGSSRVTHARCFRFGCLSHHGLTLGALGWGGFCSRGLRKAVGLILVGKALPSSVFAGRKL